jgi:hypothetical protein
MYRTHGIPEMVSKMSSNEGGTARRLRVLITDDKRYSKQDMKSMKAYAALTHPSKKLDLISADQSDSDESRSFMKDAVAILNQRSDFEAFYIDWKDYFPLSRQLRIIRYADIHMTSLGTAQFFALFLQDGAVNINLGSMGMGRRFPQWGEELLSASNPRIRATYRNVSRLQTPSVTTADVVDLVHEAASLIRSGFPIPLSKPEQNLSPVGQVLYNLVSQDEPSLHAVRGYTAPDGGFECHCNTRTGSSQSDPAPLVLGFLNASECPGINTELLRNIRKQRLGSEYDAFIAGWSIHNPCW